MLRVDTACGVSGATRRRRAGEPRRLEAAPRLGGAALFYPRGAALAAGTRAAAGPIISAVGKRPRAASEAAGAAYNLGFRSAGDSQNVI